MMRIARKQIKNLTAADMRDYKFRHELAAFMEIEATGEGSPPGRLFGQRPDNRRLRPDYCADARHIAVTEINILIPRSVRVLSMYESTLNDYFGTVIWNS